MEVLSEAEMKERLSETTMRKISPSGDVAESPALPSMWPIPFEFGNCPKGTRISISRAREIAATLRAEIAEAEFRQLRVYFDREKERADNAQKLVSGYQDQIFALREVVVVLERKLRAKARGVKRARHP